MDSKIEERFDYKGYPCVVMFQPMGFRTGYVGVPKDNILYGRCGSVLNTILECHGGVTYTEKRLYGQEDENIWWVGFDCGHAWDGYDVETTRKYFHKDISDYKRLYDGEIRTKYYVETQCRHLVEQIQDANNLTELDIVIRVMENSYADMADVAVKYLKEYKAQQETAQYQNVTMAELMDMSSDNGRIIHRRKWVCRSCWHTVMKNDVYCSHCGKKIVEWVK